MGVLHPNFGHKDIGWKKWWSILVYNCFKEFDVDEKKGLVIAKTLIKKFESMDSWNVSECAILLLEYLKCQDICLGVISNFDERLETLLCDAGLAKYFNFLMYSYKAGFAKPDIKIFNSAIAESKLTNICPNECLHIGDNLNLDYLAAKNAGWNANLILNNSNLNDNVDVPEDEVFCDLCHLLAIELLK